MSETQKQVQILYMSSYVILPGVSASVRVGAFAHSRKYLKDTDTFVWSVGDFFWHTMKGSIAVCKSCSDCIISIA